MTVRVDKWLQIARAFKTRSRATRACNLSKVRVNGLTIKSHKALALEDRIEIDYGDWQRILVVKELAEKTLPKKEAARVYEDLSPPRPERDPLEWMRRRPGVSRNRGAGRPTKQERRDMDRFLGKGSKGVGE